MSLYSLEFNVSKTCAATNLREFQKYQGKQTKANQGYIATPQLNTAI
jgi:hypothetical protein